jgi:hypothetical protein
MSKSAKKRSPATAPSTVAAATPLQQTKEANAGSKQSRVIAMLQSPTGATIAAMMKATSWQAHSVRSFLASVVRKRLKLKLASNRHHCVLGTWFESSQPRHELSISPA